LESGSGSLRLRVRVRVESPLGLAAGRWQWQPPSHWQVGRGDLLCLTLRGRAAASLRSESESAGVAFASRVLLKNTGRTELFMGSTSTPSRLVLTRPSQADSDARTLALAGCTEQARLGVGNLNGHGGSPSHRDCGRLGLGRGRSESLTRGVLKSALLAPGTRFGHTSSSIIMMMLQYHCSGPGFQPDQSP
jgi:hypothetical protein